jgi:hypothetical protein
MAAPDPLFNAALKMAHLLNCSVRRAGYQCRWQTVGGMDSALRGGDAVAEPTGRWNAHMMRVYSCGISGPQSTRPAGVIVHAINMVEKLDSWHHLTRALALSSNPSSYMMHA